MSTTRDTEPGREAGDPAGTAGEADRLLTVSLDLLLIADFEYRIRRVNPAWLEATGYTPDELLGRSFLDFVHPDDRARTREEYDRIASASSKTLDFENRGLTKDGAVRWLLWSATASAEERLVYASGKDVTARVRTERFRAAEHAVAGVAAESGGVEEAAHLMLGAVGGAMGWRRGAVWMPAEQANGGEDRLRRIASWAAPSERDADTDRRRGGEGAVHVAGEGSTPARVWVSGEPAILAAEGDRATASARPGVRGSDELLVTPIRGDGGTIGVLEFRGQVIGRADEELEELLGSLGAQVWQLFGRKRAERELTQQAMHDSLTGLPNRALLLDRLKQALARSSRTPSAVAVLFIDVDNFKDINDTRGHDVGDELLRLFAERVRRLLRPADSMARMGGDEFVLLLEDLHSERDAQRVADRILLALERPFNLGEHEQPATASIGIAVSRGQESQAGDLLRDADAAMYLVKARGRAGYEFYTERMRAEARERVETERALREGLDRDELRLIYQPQISLESGRVVAVEALVRWDHPERGLVRPRDFISVAEETGAIVSIGAWALREGCRQAASWRAELGDRAPLPLFLNLSPRQLVKPDLMATVARAITEAGIEFGDIGVEVTESALIDNAAVSMRNLRALRGAGVRVLLDDFGTGYSPLSHLNTLPLDGLKIDRSFIAGMEADPGNEAIVRAVAAMGRAMGLRVVAEGVETPEQEALAREFGCTMVQGFRFSPPVSPGELAAVLDRFG